TGGRLDGTVCFALAWPGLACTPAPSARIIPPSMTQLVVAPAPSPVTPRLARSLIGKKVLMAVTGVILFLFVVLHLLGNLKVFEGPAPFNAYAEGLRTVGAPFFARGQLLWIARIVLLGSVLLHIWAAVAVKIGRAHV